MIAAARAICTDQSSIVFASHTVQVTTDANAKPIITAFTMMSADMNMPHGDRSRGSTAAPITGAPAGSCCAHAVTGASTPDANNKVDRPQTAA